MKEPRAASDRQHLTHTFCKKKQPVDKKELNCHSHLNNADRFPWKMVGRVEEEGEEKNGTAIPAKDILKQRCSGKGQRTKSEYLYYFAC